MKITKWFESAKQTVSEMVYPFDVSCSLCGKEEGMGNGTGICTECERKLGYEPKVQETARIACFSVFPYEGETERMIRDLKYHGKRHFARTLGYYLARGIQEEGIEADWICPVPLHPKKYRQRGYNQSALIADELAERLGLEKRYDLIIRKKDTQPQVELGKNERRKNVKDAFFGMVPLNGERVLLVDDVCTTGSTLYECAKVIKKYGGTPIAVSAAHGGDHGPDRKS